MRGTRILFLATLVRCARRRLIVGGERLLPFELPWLLVLAEREAGADASYEISCGASLIHPRIALTCAHCVSNRSSSFKVSVHRHNISLPARIESPCSANIAVAAVATHPRYNPTTQAHDIALLLLESEPPCARRPGGAVRLDDGASGPLLKGMSGGFASVAGWGATDAQREAFSAVALRVQVPVLSEQLCQRIYGPLRARIRPRFSAETMLCAGNAGPRFRRRTSDSCEGDSGGPLFLKVERGAAVARLRARGQLGLALSQAAEPASPADGSKQRGGGGRGGGGPAYVQLGIVSWGISCSARKFPGVYTRVSYYLPWVRRIAKGFTSRTAPGHLHGKRLPPLRNGWGGGAAVSSGGGGRDRGYDGAALAAGMRAPWQAQRHGPRPAAGAIGPDEGGHAEVFVPGA